jgi:hypothetical protein
MTVRAVPESYEVQCIDGPAKGYTYITFVPPEDRILVHRNHPEVQERHGTWARVPNDWPEEAGETHCYALQSDPEPVVNGHGDVVLRYAEVDART